MSRTFSPQYNASFSSVSSGSSLTSGSSIKSGERYLPSRSAKEESSYRQAYIRSRSATTLSAPGDVGHSFRSSKGTYDEADNGISHRTNTRMPFTPPTSVNETSPLMPKADALAKASPFRPKTWPDSKKSKRAGMILGSKQSKEIVGNSNDRNFDFSYRNVYMTGGSSGGKGRARVGSGSGAPGACMLM
ncbi:MAG: hypothetical protein M1827_005161 [Pycnora praestabilis]|nr:MAG: hypothetical protein M1827_005161 [Pycnora praestabilis]